MSRTSPTTWRDTPRDVRPMLAELTDPRAHDRLLERQDLVFEPKYDGIRALIHITPARATRNRSGSTGSEPVVELYSRRGNNKTEQFPEVVDPLRRFSRRLDHPVLIDGEIVAIDQRGKPLGFQHLQGRLHVRGVKAHDASRAVSVAFIAFDLLRDGTEDLRSRPFTERRQRLEELFRRTGSRALRLIDSTTGGGTKLHRRALRLGWEGLVVKDPNARYFSGRRHTAWRKLKFVRTEEFVVGGWTDPRQSRTHFGALLLGYYPVADQAAATHRRRSPRRSASLIFAGQVGSGFTQAELERVAARLAPLVVDRSPFSEPSRAPERGHWVRPVLVVQTKFTEWTLDGLLRNPVYLGPRDDKPAEDVRLPDQRPVNAVVPKSVRRARRRPATRPRRTRATRPWHPEPRLTDLIDTLEALEQQKKRGTLQLSDGRRMSVGNLDKVFWPGPGITKGELLRFYLRIAPYILPVVADRPLVMKRFPNGVLGKSFYQHRAPDPLPDGLRVAHVREHPEDEESAVPYLVGGSLQTLLYMAQLAVVSQDPWFSGLDTITEADYVALDLDPMPEASFEQVLDVACWIHDELETLGIPSVAKTSGSEGLHIYIPLPPGTPYNAGMIFCQIVATVVATKHPTIATVERMVKRRQADTVYIDYLQNIYGKTLAAAYSARASEFAGVSAPLTWKEVHDGVQSGLKPDDFTMRSIVSRLDEVGDLWAALRTVEPARLEAAFVYRTP